MVLKIIRKSLLKTKVLLLSVFILFTLASSLLILSQITYDDIQNNYDQYENESNFEDYRVYVMWGLEKEVDDNWEEDFSNRYDSSIEKKEYFLSEDKTRSYGINKFDPEANINKIDLVEGSFPKEDEVLVQPEFLKRQSLKIGENLKIAGNNFTISGIAYMPEYTFPADVIGGSFSIGTDDYVPIYMNANSFDNIKRDSTTYYSSKFNKEIKDKKDMYKDMQKHYQIQVPLTDEYGNLQISNTNKILTKDVPLIALALPKDINMPLSSFEKELKGEKTMISIISAVVMIIAILVTVVLFNTIFNSLKREIGILKAEGIYKNQISKAFILHLAIILFVSSILGIALGFLLKNMMTELLATLFSFPMKTLSNFVFLKALINLFLINILVLIIVYFFSIRKNMNLKPLILIKNIKKEKTPKFSFNFITKNLKFLKKYKFNIFIRNITLAFLLAFGVFVSSFLLLMGGTMYSSIYSVTNSTYDDIFTYKYEAVYTQNVRDEVFDKNSIIKKTINVNNLSNDYELTEDNSTLKIYAYNFDNEYINLKTQDDNSPNKEDIYLTKLALEKYNLKIGDEIKIENPFDVQKDIIIKIDGILNDPIHSYIYMDINKAQNLLNLDEDYANGEVGNEDKKEELFKYDKNVNYQESIDFKSNLKSLTKVTLVFTLIIAIISFIIAFITLSMIINSLIKNNQKTISVMKVLGYSDGEINSMTTSFYKWIIILVYFGSIPIFKIIIQEILDKALKDLDISITINIGLRASLFGFVVIIVVYITSMIISKRQIKKIKLSQSLKVDE